MTALLLEAGAGPKTLSTQPNEERNNVVLIVRNVFTPASCLPAPRFPACDYSFRLRFFQNKSISKGSVEQVVKLEL